MTYPNGRVLTYRYGSAGADASSRFGGPDR